MRTVAYRTTTSCCNEELEEIHVSSRRQLIHEHDAVNGRVSSICTWLYVVTQVKQRVNGFSVALNHVIRPELRPTCIADYLNEDVIERTVVAS